MGNRNDAEQPTVDLEVRPSLLRDATLLAPRLREADLDEITAHSGGHPIASLQHGIRNSAPCFTVDYKGQPAAIFGTVPCGGLGRDISDSGGWGADDDRLNQIDGAVWLLGSDDIDLFSRQFLRWSQHWMDRITRDYCSVGNIVDERNNKHVRWLGWLGFDFVDRIQFGPQNMWFHRFYKEIKASV